MPFKSNAQRKFLYAKHPAVAKKFAADSKGGLKGYLNKTKKAS